MVCTKLCEDADKAPGERGGDFAILVGWHGLVENSHSTVSASLLEVPGVLGLGGVFQFL